MKKSQSNFSVVIITFNEEDIIQHCIQAAQKVTDDIVIIDSFSTDKTKAICTQFETVNFIEQEWLGYSEQKNFGNAKAKHPWILSLDADEILGEKIIENLKILNLEDKQYVYKINRLNNYCGKWIKHGRWYPEWRNRLFHKDIATWNGDLVHEDICAKEKAILYKKIKGYVLHYSMKNKAEHLAKAEKYAQLSAQKMYAQGKKASFVKRFLSPVSRFLVDYFFKLGFLDGTLGFQIAKISAFETYLKYKLLQEKYKNEYRN